MKTLALTTFIFCILLSLTSCTFNISMAHTQGAADDVIDDTSNNTPTISPDITLPIGPASNLGVK